MEAAAGYSHGQNHCNNIFLNARCKEAATANFMAEGPSPSEFRCLFKVFLLRGAAAETSGRTLDTLQNPKVSFRVQFGYPWASF